MKLHERALLLAAMSAMLLSFTGAAAPKIVYVVPGGAGAKDGTSWEAAMADVKKAYASAAAFAADGYDSGEVWIKTGRYQTSQMTLTSNTTVRGGFRGTETVADEADPVKYPTLLTGDTNQDDQWYPNGAAPEGEPQPIWTGDDLMTFNPPNPEGKYDYCKAYQGSAKNEWGLFYSYNVSLVNCRFIGLTIADYYRHPIDIESKTDGVVSSGIEVRDCTFCANGTEWLSYLYDNCIFLVNASGIVSNCTFIGNCCCIYSKNQSQTDPAYGFDVRVMDCRFERSGMNGIYAYCNSNADRITFERCVFDGNYADQDKFAAVGYFPKNGGTPGATISFTDCQIMNNLTKGASSAAIYYGGADSDLYARHDFIRCSFVGNRLVRGSSSSAVAACVLISGTGRHLRFTDCLFERNTCDYAGTLGGWSVLSCTTANDRAHLLNCTFRGNRATATAAGAVAGTIGTSVNNLQMFLVNCTFENDETEAVSPDHAADCLLGGTVGSNTFVRFLNTIMWSSEPGYRPVWNVLSSTALPRVWMLQCKVRNFDAEALSAVASVVRNDHVDASGEDPKLSDRRMSAWSGTVGVTQKSPRAIRRDGTRAWWSESGTTFAIYDPDYYGTAKPWYVLGGGGYQQTDEAAAAMGLSCENPPLPDFFDQPRVAGRIAYGPLNAPVSGLMLLLR